MNEIIIDVDSAYLPMKVVLRENGKTILDMPADELLSKVKLWIAKDKEDQARADYIEKTRTRVGLWP